MYGLGARYLRRRWARRLFLTFTHLALPLTLLFLKPFLHFSVFLWMLTGSGTTSKVAVTVVSAPSVTTQVLAPAQAPPDQPAKLDPKAGEGLSVTVDPSS